MVSQWRRALVREGHIGRWSRELDWRDEEIWAGLRCGCGVWSGLGRAGCGCGDRAGCGWDCGAGCGEAGDEACGHDGDEAGERSADLAEREVGDVLGDGGVAQEEHQGESSLGGADRGRGGAADYVWGWGGVWAERGTG